jgi:hypothetical protein
MRSWRRRQPRCKVVLDEALTIPIEHRDGHRTFPPGFL